MRLIQLSAVAALFAPALTSAAEESSEVIRKRLGNVQHKSANGVAEKGSRHLQDEECQGIVDIAVGNPDFSTLVAAVTAAGLVDALSGDGPLTVFAPTNDAFAALPEGTVETLLLPENIDTLTSILTYHVVAAEVPSTALENGDVETLNGASVTVNLDDGVKINDSNVITPDIQACNGIIHVIDAVLLPPAPEPETLPEEEMSMSMPECQGIVDIAVGNPDFSTLVAAVTAAGLVDALSGDGPLTVFAPTNDAFAALPDGTVESLLLPENIDTLTSILTYHVVAAEVPSTALENGDVETLNGASVTVNLDDGVKINDSNVIIPDIMACNGIIHVIDAVLLPPADEEPETLPEEEMSMSMPECQGIVDIAVGNPDFSTLVAAVTAAGLVDALSGDGPLTVFAPTNDAFAALPDGTVESLLLPENIDTLTSILTYHVVGAEVPSTALENGDVETLNGASVTVNLDDGVKINDSNVIIPDIMACNGIIHVIDAVLLPPADEEPETLPEEEMSMSMSDCQGIVDIAVGNPDFSTLVAAVTAAGLVDALSGDGPLTVFAPTNDAFAALPEGTVETLLLPENLPQLTGILTYHVVAAEVPSTALENGDVETLNGASVTVNLDDGVKINDSNVIIADIMACNGIIHVIDAVLLPPMDMAPEEGGGDDDSVTSAKAEKEPGMMGGKSGKSKSSKAKTLKETPMAKTTKVEKAEEALLDAKAEKISKSSKGKSSKAKSGKSESEACSKSEKMAPTRRLGCFKAS